MCFRIFLGSWFFCPDKKSFRCIWCKAGILTGQPVQMKEAHRRLGYLHHPVLFGGETVPIDGSGVVRILYDPLHQFGNFNIAILA